MQGSGIKVAVFTVVVGVFAGGGSTRADFVVCDPRPVDGAINSRGARHPGGCSFLHDGLKLYFTSGRDPSNTNARDLWVSERESPDAPWGEAVKLGPNVSKPTANETKPAISPDELELYWEEYRYGASGYHWMRSTRASKDDPWGPGADFTALGNGGLDFAPDGLSVYFSDSRAGGYGGKDIWVATRATTDGEWGEPVNLGRNVNDAGGQIQPSISSDGLALFFADWTAKGIFMCTRTTTNDSWGPHVDLSPAVNLQRARNPEISPDGSTLYFSSPDSPVYGQISIKPVVDFDDDGQVGMNDLLTMIESWGTDNTVCDIGPMPWGDGVVDRADLEILMERWGEKTPVYIVVDNFESYNDDVNAGTAIFHAWIDGAGYKQPAPAHPGNGTGALVGNWPPPYAEQVIVHGGFQSLPLRYDNDGAVWDMTGLTYYAETQRMWDDPQDWTRKGVEILTLWFHGDPGNSVEPFYVALEDNAGNRKDIPLPDPAAVTIDDWKQWRIPLTDFTDVDPKAIKIMSIGVGDPASTEPGGSGVIYVDDIELHRSTGQ